MKSGMHGPRAIALLLISTLILSGCASMTNSSALQRAPAAAPKGAIDSNKTACGAFGPIYWSRDDSDQTIMQIKSHNAAWTALCRKEK